MTPKNVRRRRSSNGRRRRVATRVRSKWQHATFWQSHDQRGDVQYIGGQIPLRRPRRRIRGGGGCSDGKGHRGGRWKRSPVTPGRRVWLRAAFRRHQLRSALSGPGSDGRRCAHLQSIIHTNIGLEEFGRGMTPFWRRIVDKLDAFRPEFWQLFLPSSLTALGE